MTPRRPIELVQASQDCAEAWLKRDEMIDAGDTVGVKAMNEVCDLLQERYNTIHREWQILGGTSNIESIALPLPAKHYEEFAGSEWELEMTARHADALDEEQTNLDAQGRRYDFTPTPKDMPIIDFDNIDEISF